MNTSITDIEQTKKEIKVIVPSQEFEKFFKKATDKLAKDVELKGFRKGQAPINMAVGALDQAEILKEAVDMALKELYPQILKKHNLEVLGPPEIEILKLASKNPFEFKAKVFVLPEVKLPDYKKIAGGCKRQKIFVEDKEVEEVFKQLQETKDKIPLEQRNLINLDKPEELKKTLRQEIEREKEIIEKQRLRNEILENIAKNCDLEMPEILVLAEKYRVMEDLKTKVDKVLKISFEDYLKKIKKSEKELEELLKKDISERLKRILILREIQAQEKIEAKEDELKKEVEVFLNHPANQKIKPDIDQIALKSYLKERIEQEKTLQFLESLSR